MMEESKIIQALRAWKQDNARHRLAVQKLLGVPEGKLRSAPGYYNKCMDMCAEQAMDMLDGCEDSDCAMAVEEAMAGCYEGCNGML